jgi:hypothetical protein
MKMITKDLIFDCIKTVTENSSDFFEFEWNFQCALANELKNKLLKKYPEEYDVIIEYCTQHLEFSENYAQGFDDKPSNKDKSDYFIDIVLKNKNIIYPIQLKYSAFNEEGRYSHGTCGGLSTYGFIEDIYILEKLPDIIEKSKSKLKIGKSYCVFLTNDPYVLNKSKNDVYGNFVIGEEISNEEKIYRPIKKGNESTIKLENNYKVHRKDLETGKFKGFKILLVEI